jgi:uncharacterized protein (DUF2062 family)
MSKKHLQKYLPHPDTFRNMKALRFLGDHLHSPNLWHFNRRSVARAFAIGLWAMYTPPLPWQQIMAGILAVYLEANLPIAVSLVWITNPLTWIPLYYLAYKVGLMALGMEGFGFAEFSDLFSIERIMELGTPLLLGCAILMHAGGLLGYFGTRYLWRRSVLHRWQLRKHRNAAPDTAFMAGESCSDYRRLLIHRERHQQVMATRKSRRNTVGLNPRRG